MCNFQLLVFLGVMVHFFCPPPIPSPPPPLHPSKKKNTPARPPARPDPTPVQRRRKRRDGGACVCVWVCARRWEGARRRREGGFLNADTAHRTSGVKKKREREKGSFLHTLGCLLLTENGVLHFRGGELKEWHFAGRDRWGQRWMKCRDGWQSMRSACPLL